MKKNNNSDLFMILSIIFVVCLLISNILASKLLLIYKWAVPAGVLVFPISYIINDILTEVYSYDKAKKIIILGFIMNIFMVIIFNIAIYLPSPSYYTNSNAFKEILGSTPRNLIASLIAYLLGSITNAKIMSIMKQKTKDKFALRAIISTLFGELIDSSIFITIAFLFKLTILNMISMIIMQVIIKTLYEIICLPITKKVIKTIKLKEKIK
jgi:uncharacterized integral membrane protein (TIGR00697 family)